MLPKDSERGGLQVLSNARVKFARNCGRR